MSFSRRNETTAGYPRRPSAEADEHGRAAAAHQCAQGRDVDRWTATYAVVHDEEFMRELDHYSRRHRVKPGITGWAQVNGLRGETRTSEQLTRRMGHDLYYVANWSILVRPGDHAAHLRYPSSRAKRLLVSEVQKCTSGPRRSSAGHLADRPLGVPSLLTLGVGMRLLRRVWVWGAVAMGIAGLAPLPADAASPDRVCENLSRGGVSATRLSALRRGFNLTGWVDHRVEQYRADRAKSF